MIAPLHLLTLDGRLDLLIPQVMIDEFERNRPRVEASVTSDVTQLFKLIRRDPVQYGRMSLNELETKIYEWANELTVSVRCRQTNSEGEYVGWIHDAFGDVDGVIVNPGAWTHYSYAIREALELFDAPIVEVHLSNIDEREEWRRVSVISDVVAHRVIGKGPEGYKEAIEWLSRHE